MFFQYFVAPPECCPQPRWLSVKYSEVFDVFVQASRDVPSNVHLVTLYKTEPIMFELDGRHFKSYCGKDYLDHLLQSAESGMIRVSLDADDRQAQADNRIAAVEGRVELVRRDLGRSDQRLNVVVARAAEEADGIANEK